MRRAALLSVLFFLVAVATAQAQDGSTSVLPAFKVSVTKLTSDDGYGGGAWQIEATVPGCYEPSDGIVDPDYDYESGDCGSATMRLSRNHHLLKAPQFDLDDKSGLGSVYYRWTCARSGAYAWRVSYSNISVPGYTSGRPYTDAKSGTFRIPRCRTPQRRRIAKGAVQQHENTASQSAYKTEFISSIRCRPASSVRYGKASKWRCDVTHNNNYRECVDHDTVISYKTDKWGQRDIHTDITTNSKSCRDY